jgi:hypothetical protein
MFHSDEEQDQVGISLAAIGGMVHDVTIDKSVLDHSAGAVPHVRIANRTEVTKKVDHIASLVGTERFFLKVGEMLYTKGAEIGLQREGILTKSDDERIQAEKILNEPVHPEHRHSERVINPAISEIVAMMGQIDEFKRIRAQVKQAAIAEKLKPADVDKVDKDVKKFLDDPEVKNSFDSLEKASGSLVEANTELAAMEERDPEICEVAKEISRANGKFVDIFPDGIPENYDFCSDGRIFEAVVKSLPTTQGEAKYLSDPKVVVDCVAEQVRQSELAYACLVALNDTRKRCEEFGNRHPQAKEYFEKAVAAGGYIVDAAAIISSWAGGPTTGIPVTGMVLASRSEAGEAVANGIVDVLSNGAKACARTDQEQQEFADTARFCVQTAGAANIVSSMGKFASRSPHPKSRRTPTESIAIRETELAGTGLKVKVPVEERATTAVNHMESAKVNESATIVSGKTSQDNRMRADQLLPKEGEVGSYSDLLAKGTKGDNISPDHIPSAAFMEKFGKKKMDGICMNMEHYHPGEGGRHRDTRTYGNTQNAESTLPPRSELAADILDRKKIYQEDGLYNSGIRKSLQNVIKQNKEAFPDMFEKRKN